MFMDFMVVCAIVCASGFAGLKIAECLVKIAHALGGTCG